MKSKAATQTLLEQIRETCGFRRWRVAKFIDMDQTGLKKVEVGRSRPTEQTASALFDFYGGLVPLGLIYDTHHYSFEGWLTAHQVAKLRRRAKEISREYPDLFPDT